ncbi:hypothetical protein BD410DRAFT_402466 [Rickenella mellea]|uniref:Uncharacterized protein n=1 Tax=Rickenella mellea TaxID=50990 RepID=A0A4Y7PXE6_9AGAM|nr:hypothetical protein BD410DRAFT_402466 [Rickenella mellea]
MDGQKFARIETFELDPTDQCVLVWTPSLASLVHVEDAPLCMKFTALFLSWALFTAPRTVPKSRFDSPGTAIEDCPKRIWYAKAVKANAMLKISMNRSVCYSIGCATMHCRFHAILCERTRTTRMTSGEPVFLSDDPHQPICSSGFARIISDLFPSFLVSYPEKTKLAQRKNHVEFAVFNTGHQKDPPQYRRHLFGHLHCRSMWLGSHHPEDSARSGNA